MGRLANDIMIGWEMHKSNNQKKWWEFTFSFLQHPMLKACLHCFTYIFKFYPSIPRFLKKFIQKYFEFVCLELNFWFLNLDHGVLDSDFIMHHILVPYLHFSMCDTHINIFYNMFVPYMMKTGSCTTFWPLKQ